MIKIKNEEIFEEVDEIKSIEAFESDNNKTFFKGSGENLKNYRIYGENGKNLLNDKELKIGGLNAINGEEIVDTTTIRSPFIKGFFSNYRYYLTLFNDEYKIENIYYYNYNYLFLGKIEVNSNYTNFTPISSTLFIRITFKKKDETQNISTLDLENKVVLSKGKAALSYEPYGESVGDRTGNLFDNYPNTITNKEIIYSNVNNQYMTIVGESSGIYSQTGYVTYTLPQGTYFLKWYLDNEIYNSNVFMLIRDNNDIDIVNVNANGASFTLNNEQEIKIKIGVIQSGVNINTKIYVQINSGSSPLPYEPYGYKVPVTVEGKNLLPNAATSQTIKGVTFTVNNDGSVTCNGTSTSQYYSLFRIPCYLVAGNYTISGCPVGGNSRKYRADIRISPDGGMVGGDADTGAGVTIPIDESGWYDYTIRIQGGYTVDDVTFKPMIRKADIEDDTYEPYHAPVTTPIYLDAPLCKVNGAEEYIDFLTQKVHRIQKNLLPNNAQLPTTINGVKWSIRESDGAIMAERVSPSESPSDLVYTSSFIAPANQIFVLKLFYEGEEPSATTYSANVIYNNIDHWNRNGMYRFETDTEMSVVLRVSPEYNGIAIFAPMISNYNYNDVFDYTPYIQNTEQSIILPAISTFSDTNILSVNTKVEPSKIWGRISEPRDIEYVKDNLGNILFSKYHEVEEEPPLSYTAKKAGFLADYRIYGQTVDGESVGNLVTSGEHAGEYKVPVTVEGKNLLRNTYTEQSYTKNGVTFTVNADGSITCNGTASTTTYFDINKNFNSTLYAGMKASFYQSGQHPSVNSFRVRMSKADRITLEDFTMNNQLIYDKGDSLLLAIRIASGYTCDNLTIYPMIRKADIEDDTYEPYRTPVTTSIYLPKPIKIVGDEAEYIDYGEQKLHRVRKNLLQNTAISQTINGVTFTVNSDGSVTCNGKCVNNVAVLYIKRPTTFYDGTIQYTLTGCPAGGAYNSTYALEYTNSVNQTKPDVGNGVSFTPYRKEYYPNACTRIVIFVGYTCDNLTFYPMIRKASITDDTYEPYIENTDLDVTLPALPTVTGTNVLSVGTEVQPSDVYIKGKIKSLN